MSYYIILYVAIATFAIWMFLVIRRVLLFRKVALLYSETEANSALMKFISQDPRQPTTMDTLNEDIMNLTKDLMKVSNKIQEYRKMSYRELKAEWQHLQDLKEMFE